jgi:hypothetical protein
METNEERGYQRLHGLFRVPVGPRDEPLSSLSLAQVREPIAALLLELPQRALGGTLPSWGVLGAQVDWARDRGAAVHLRRSRSRPNLSDVVNGVSKPAAVRVVAKKSNV